MPEFEWQFTLVLVTNGIMIGLMYALIALGFVLIFKATDAINFAQGEFVMFAGFIAAAGAEIAGFPPMNAAAHGEFGRAFYAGFPDMSHTIDETIVAGDRVVTRFTLRGSHTAPFMGIPATGRSITVTAIVILTVADGRVVHLRATFDQLGLLRQLGVVPA